MSIITRRKLTTQEKRAERIFDEDSYERHRRALPEYEVLPEHKSYLDLGVRTVEEKEVTRGNIFSSRNRSYDYEVVTPVARNEKTPEYIISDDLDVLKFKTEAMPSEETMKVLLSDRISAETAERMLSGAPAKTVSRSKTDDVIIIDETLEEDQSEKQAHITLNSKGKIAVAVYVVVILTMLIIALVTASSIATLSAQEESLEAQLSEIYYGGEDFEGIYELQRNADALSAPTTYEVNGKLAEQNAGFSMYVPTEGNGITTIAVAELKAETGYQVSGNWFDAICKFIAGLFGR